MEQGIYKSSAKGAMQIEEKNFKSGYFCGQDMDIVRKDICPKQDSFSVYRLKILVWAVFKTDN